MEQIQVDKKHLGLFKKIISFLEKDPYYSIADLAGCCQTSERKVKYAFHIMEYLGIISYEPKQNPSGRFLTSKKTILNSNIIEKQVINNCTECGVEVIKSKSSKHKDLCHECTEAKFMSRVKIPCDYCGELVEKKAASKLERKTKFFHSICAAKYREERRIGRAKERCCSACGKEVDRKGIYCTSCYESMQKYCKYCNSKMSSQSNTNVCNELRCKTKQIIEKDTFGGIKSSSSIQSLYVKNALGDECCICGYSSLIHYHHIVERKDGGEDRISNLIPLCPNHHAEHHKLSLDLTEGIKKIKKRLTDFMNN